MALGACSLALVACALVQDPLDAWSLKLDLGSESLPTSFHQVEL